MAILKYQMKMLISCGLSCFCVSFIFWVKLFRKLVWIYAIVFIDQLTFLFCFLMQCAYNAAEWGYCENWRAFLPIEIRTQKWKHHVRISMAQPSPVQVKHQHGTQRHKKINVLFSFSFHFLFFFQLLRVVFVCCFLCCSHSEQLAFV